LKDPGCLAQVLLIAPDISAAARYWLNEVHPEIFPKFIPKLSEVYSNE
jgi:hypothetical protein